MAARLLVLACVRCGIGLGGNNTRLTCARCTEAIEKSLSHRGTAAS